MSKKVAILEGDKTRRFSGVKYLRTKLASGGTCEWVPEDERKLTTKHITKNGTYKASDEKGDYYGYSEVTVNVSNKTTGKDNPATGGDGNEYSVTTDEETGQLKKKVLPSSIKIVGLPTKTSYVDGEAINKGGMVVKAYKADGTLYDYSGYQQGAIPLSELEIEPTKAKSSGSSDSPEWDVSGLDLNEPVNLNPVSVGDVVSHWTDPDTIVVSITSDSPVYFASNGNDFCYISLSPFSMKTARRNGSYPGGYTGHAQTVGEYTAYISGNMTASRAMFDEKYEMSAGQDMDFDNAMIIAICGGHPKHGSQTITVKWKRPDDDKELTDTFKITVSSNTEEE